MPRAARLTSDRHVTARARRFAGGEEHDIWRASTSRPFDRFGVAIAGGIALLATGVANAAIPDRNGGIQSCYITRTGKMRVIDMEGADLENRSENHRHTVDPSNTGTSTAGNRSYTIDPPNTTTSSRGSSLQNVHGIPDSPRNQSRLECATPAVSTRGTRSSLAGWI
ncbi:MAG: hypothetical protein JSU66_14190 [Deltaproteobacteria bacterium]|nr:MAG: hypothetical protein JSU66_14190 [Deltaproteobacteria bacterium]